jgi:hypothetical protein
VILHQALGLAEHDELPQPVQEKYWEMKRIFDRTGTLPTQSDLCMLVFSEFGGKPLDRELAPPSIVDLWRKRQIDREARVLVEWRKKKVEAVFKGVNGANEVVVQMIGDPDERAFAPDLVSLPAA